MGRTRAIGQAGFTLLELLIALTLFALLGLGTYRMLEAVLQSDAAIARQERELRELSRAVWAFERDLQQALARPIRDGYGDQLNAFMGQISAENDSALLEFTRTGWRNPTGLQRADLQRVHWRLAGDRLERLYWVVLDRDVASQPRVQQVLGRVGDFRLRYLDRDANWHDQWPPLQQTRGNPAAIAARVPQAVEMSFEHARHGRIVRLLRLPDATATGPQVFRYEGLPPGVEP